MVQKIGYDKAAACAKKAHKEGSTLKASIFSGSSAVCVNVQILSRKFVNLVFFIFHLSIHYKILVLAAAQISTKVLNLLCKKVYNTHNSPFKYMQLCLLPNQRFPHIYYYLKACHIVEFGEATSYFHAKCQ